MILLVIRVGGGGHTCVLERLRISGSLILLQTKSLGSIPDPFTIEEKRQEEEGGGISIFQEYPCWG